MAFGCSSLGELRDSIGDCHRCSLGDTRSTLVFGVGNPHARVMFIGEAPGRNEDLQGEPFVGAAGKFLDELLGEAGLRREDVYIANVLKCRPPGNRDPVPEEIDTCTPFLREQIRSIAPQVLVTLGNFATKFVLKTQTGITRLHGTVQHAGPFIVFPSYHPAVALYDRSKQEALYADFRKLGGLLSGLSRSPEAGDGLARGVDHAAAGSEISPASVEVIGAASSRQGGNQPGSRDEPEQGTLF